ncbi:unnamed protein product [Rotaria sp. Silwood1]|nr:unnamed protein product [Rotaria sp. Silwood1]
MSFSTLESLPNEILTDIIEKYINGIDLLRAFSFQLNQRFDSLIIQCQRLCFDFIQCHQDDFRLCMGLLPAYIDKVEELAISEENTPGQVYAFLSFFPSFAVFKRLQTLYFHFDSESMDKAIIGRALISLSQTTIETLSIIEMNADFRSPLKNVIVDLFRLKSLKLFSLKSNLDYINCEYLADVSSNIEYLTISGIHFEFEDLKYIFQCARRLKYLNIQLTDSKNRYFDEPKMLLKRNIAVSSALRTLVLYFSSNNSITMDMLREYFNSMPILNRLEVIAHNELLDANAWQMLLETSLPSLIHFTLRTTISRIGKANVHNGLASFQSSYWYLLASEM